MTSQNTQSQGYISGQYTYFHEEEPTDHESLNEQSQPQASQPYHLPSFNQTSLDSHIHAKPHSFDTSSLERDPRENRFGVGTVRIENATGKEQRALYNGYHPETNYFENNYHIPIESLPNNLLLTGPYLYGELGASSHMVIDESLSKGACTFLESWLEMSKRQPTDEELDSLARLLKKDKHLLLAWLWQNMEATAPSQFNTSSNLSPSCSQKAPKFRKSMEEATLLSRIQDFIDKNRDNHKLGLGDGDGHSQHADVHGSQEVLPCINGDGCQLSWPMHRKFDWKRHLRIWEPQSFWECGICLKILGRAHHLAGHIKNKHGADTTISNNIASTGLLDYSPPYSRHCAFCSKLFDSFEKFTEHLAKKHYALGHTLDQPHGNVYMSAQPIVEIASSPGSTSRRSRRRRNSYHPRSSASVADYTPSQPSTSTESHHRILVPAATESTTIYEGLSARSEPFTGPPSPAQARPARNNRGRSVTLATWPPNRNYTLSPNDGPLNHFIQTTERHERIAIKYQRQTTLLDQSVSDTDDERVESLVGAEGVGPLESCDGGEL